MLLNYKIHKYKCNTKIKPKEFEIFYIGEKLQMWQKYYK